jgi:hypothetical protein
MVEFKPSGRLGQDLLITLTDKESFLDEFEDKLNTMEVSDLLDISGHLGNGWDDVTNHIGLTEAPAIAYEVIRDEEGLPVEWGAMWYYSNYMIENPFEILLENGEVLFTYGN